MGELLTQFGNWLLDVLTGLVYFVGIFLIDTVEYVLGLLPAAPAGFSLQTYLSALPSDLLLFLGYMQFSQMVSVIITAYSIRAVLMVFGR